MGDRGCVLVIGLDGATYKVLDPLMEKGVLPNLSKICKEGAHGILRSTVPPLSGPAWTSFSTGLNPGKHGVFSWRRDPRSREAGNLVTSRTVIGDKIWTIMGHAGKKSAVMGLPVTYPPEDIKGVMVTGILTPNDAKVFTYPKSLSDELRAIGYRTDYELRNDDYDGKEGTRRALYEEIKELTGTRVKAIELLDKRGPWDLFIVMFGQTDQVQHFFWDDKKVLAEFFGIVDAHIGRIVEIFSRSHERLHVIVMSDHGFDAAPTKSFSLNAWLEEQGFASKEEREARSHLFDFARKLGRGLKKVGIDLGKTHLARKRFDNQTRRVLEGKLVVLEGHGLFIDQERAKDRFDEIKGQIAIRLRELKDPNGDNVFAQVYCKEDIYRGTGVGMDLAPDIVFVPVPDYYIDPGLLATEMFGSHGRGSGIGRTNWTGMHNGTPDGVLMMMGPGIERGKVIPDSSIMDIAPTILHLADLEVPADMDGKVIAEALTRAFLEERPIRRGKRGSEGHEREGFEYSDDEAKDVERRLKSLGYLD